MQENGFGHCPCFWCARLLIGTIIVGMHFGAPLLACKDLVFLNFIKFPVINHLNGFVSIFMLELKCQPATLAIPRKDVSIMS